MTKKQKKLLQRITAAAILFAAGMLLPLFAETSDYIIFALFGISYIIIGWDIIWKAFCNIRQGEAFDENFLMTVATRRRCRYAVLPNWRMVPELCRFALTPVYYRADGYPPGLR